MEPGLWLRLHGCGGPPPLCPVCGSRLLPRPVGERRKARIGGWNRPWRCAKCHRYFARGKEQSK